MSRSAGPGSPILFTCPVERAERARAYNQGDSGTHAVRKHETKLTGRTRRYTPNRGSARGLRSSAVSREYRCLTCGHVGWSNHVDLARRAERT